jgi:hypothetical protein
MFARLPHEGEEMRGFPRIEANVNVFNIGMLTGTLATRRAKDCRGVVYFENEEAETVFQHDCRWSKSDSPSTNVPTGLLPQILRLFAIDPVAHGILPEQKDKEAHYIGSPAAYQMTLVLDYDDGKATNIDLGELRLPEDVLADNEWIEVWKMSFGKSGWGIFPERTADGRLLAKVIGTVPEKRLAELKNSEVLKHFTFEAV